MLAALSYWTFRLFSIAVMWIRFKRFVQSIGAPDVTASWVLLIAAETSFSCSTRSSTRRFCMSRDSRRNPELSPVSVVISRMSSREKPRYLNSRIC